MLKEIRVHSLRKSMREVGWKGAEKGDEMGEWGGRRVEWWMGGGRWGGAVYGK